MKSPKENEAEGGREGGDIELAVGDSEHEVAGTTGARARERGGERAPRVGKAGNSRGGADAVGDGGSLI